MSSAMPLWYSCRNASPTRGIAGITIPGSSLALIEREAILRTVESVGGSTSRAAKILGISPRKIQYRLKDYHADAHSPVTRSHPVAS